MGCRRWWMAGLRTASGKCWRRSVDSSWTLFLSFEISPEVGGIKRRRAVFMRMLRSALLALAVALVAGALGTGTALADTVVIDAVDSPLPAFSPPNVTIHTGDTVRFEFDQATATHTVTANNPNWTINEVRNANGAPISKTFDTAGTYTFLCTVHNNMSGSITVSDTPANTLSKVLVF